MAEPTPPPSTTEIVDPIVVPESPLRNQCIDANCTLCAPTPQPPTQHIPETVVPSDVEIKKTKKGRSVRVKIDVEVRLPKKGDHGA